MRDRDRGEIAKHEAFTPAHRFRLVPFDKIKPSSTSAYLIRGLIPRDGLIVVWGPPKSGKSFWTYDAVMHVALGWEYDGRRTTQGTVVYIAAEGERGLGTRTEAFRRERLAEAREPVPFYLLCTRIDLAADGAMLIADIRAQLGEGGCAAIVIDTLNRSIGGSESDDGDMGAYVKAADAIREAFGCAVIIVHHCGVNDKRPRGHTSLTGAADAQVAITRDTDNTVVATVEYLKDGEAGAVIRSTLRKVILDPDEDGEEVTSMVIEPADKTTATAHRSRKSITGQPKVALDLLRRSLAEAGEPAPPDCAEAGQNPVVPVDLWRRHCYAGLIEGRDNPDSQRRAFNRAAAKLQALGVIGYRQGFAWVIP